jgi:DNA-binding MarR family transcriptional regulator
LQQFKCAIIVNHNKKSYPMDISIVRKFREYIRHIERELNIQNNATCCEGVTLAQCHTLLEVYTHKSISLNELSEKLYLDKSTVSRTVDSLVKNGTANRVIPEENRRKVTISLTGKGNGICRQINRDSDAYFDAIIKSIPAGDLPVFLRSFETMVKKMIEINQDTPESCK